jgi:sulfate permease, SulP family
LALGVAALAMLLVLRRWLPRWPRALSVAAAAGQKTQMASLINTVLILITMLFLASLFADLASAVLGAVVIDAMIGLINFGELRRYYRVNRSDWLFFMGAMLGILFLGIVQGILIGVVLSLLA